MHTVRHPDAKMKSAARIKAILGRAGADAAADGSGAFAGGRVGPFPEWLTASRPAG
jgi:hypothetical protein